MRRFDPGPRLQFLRNPSRTRLYLCQPDVLGGTVTRLLISLNELFRLRQQLTGWSSAPEVHADSWSLMTSMRLAANRFL